MTVAQTTPSKPKTLKELIAEEKAAKEAAKAAEAANDANKSPNDTRKSASNGDASLNDGKTPEDAADYVTETDSAIWRLYRQV